MLLEAIGGTLKTASFALLLLLIIMYMFGIAISQVVAGYVEERRLGDNLLASDNTIMFYFGSIYRTIFTLFMTISGGVGWGDVVLPLSNAGPIGVLFYVIFVALMILVVMNVLIGIFCQCAIESAANDRESIIQFHISERDRYIRTLTDYVNEVGLGGDGMYLSKEFKDFVGKDARMQALLRSLDINVTDAISLFDLLDQGSGLVPIDEFVTGCITLRGGAKAVQIETVHRICLSLEQRFLRIEELLEGLKATSSIRDDDFVGTSTTNRVLW